MASTENTCIQLKKLIDILMFKKKKPEFGAYFKFMIVELLFIFVASIIFVFTSALKNQKINLLRRY